jgi:hypothetical protein
VQEPKFSHITRNLFLTLAANGRIGEAGRVIRDFEGTCLTRLRCGALYLSLFLAKFTNSRILFFLFSPSFPVSQS